MRVTFHWHYEMNSPRLLMAVGSVILEWSWIDHDITKICEFVWHFKYPKQSVPRAFNARIKGLKEVYKTIYASEPDEYRQLCWFIQRLRDINNRRDDLAHGRPGRAQINDGDWFECLMVPFPSRDTKYTPMNVEGIEKLHSDLKLITNEVRDVSDALTVALQASSGNISTWQDPHGLMPLTMANRSPMIPRLNAPPPTFRE